MRLFDELTGIKHPSKSMKAKRLIYILAACVISLTTYAQTNAPTGSPPTTQPAPIVPAVPLGSAKGAVPPPDTNQPVVALPSIAPIQSRNTRALTIEDCIKLALAHNLDIQIQEFNPRIDQFTLNAVYGAYEPVFNFTGTKSYSDRPGDPGLIDPTTGQPELPNIQEQNNYSPEIKVCCRLARLTT